MCVYRCTSHSCGDLRNVCLHDSRRIPRFSVCGVVGTKSAQAEERVSRATLERNFTRNSRNLERCWNARFDIVQGRRNAAKAFNNTITNGCSVSLVPPRNIEFLSWGIESFVSSASKQDLFRSLARLRYSYRTSKERCTIEISLFINRPPFIYTLETVVISLFTHTLMFISVV